MGNYEQLKQSVSDVIKTNGNQEITGSILQNVLLTIISSVGANATFAGIATPTTNPGTPDGSVFYLASENGTYSNFGGIELQAGLSVLMWNGSWSSQQIFGIDNEPTAGSDNLVKSGGVQEELALGAVYDVSAKNPTAGVNNDGKWDSLSALLSDANLNTLIPTAVRKGGMSIKFVQSSDNKYVQARCMAQNFTTDVTQWQGVDDEPTAGSENLVKSGGVYAIIGTQNVLAIETIKKINTDINYKVIEPSWMRTGVKINYDFQIISDAPESLTVFFGKHRIGVETGGVESVISFISVDENGHATGSVDIPTDFDFSTYDVVLQVNNGNATKWTVTINENERITEHFNEVHTEIQSVDNTYATYMDYLKCYQTEKTHTTSQFKACSPSWVKNGVLVKYDIHITNSPIPSTIGTAFFGRRNKTSGTIQSVIAVVTFDVYGHSTGEFIVSELTSDLEMVFSINSGNSLTWSLFIKDGEQDNLIDEIPSIKEISQKFDEQQKSYVRKLKSFILAEEGNDEYEQATVIFDGDSIFGSQLEAVTAISGNENEQPYNLNRQTCARKFYDKYQWNNNIKFRRLDHNDWTKYGTFTAWTIESATNPNAGSYDFNNVKTYKGAAVGDNAQIIVNGYEHFKLVWSNYGYKYWKCRIEVSADGGTTFATPSSLGLGDGKDTILHSDNSVKRENYDCYCYNLNSQLTYIFKVTIENGPTEVRLFGCEMWNGSRLNVIVEAASGTTAKMHADWMTSYLSYAKFKPLLYIWDILYYNDNSYLYRTDYTLKEYSDSINHMVELLSENNIPVVGTTPHGHITSSEEQTVITNYLVEMQNYMRSKMGFVDIYKYFIDNNLSVGHYTSDGTHLNDAGNTLYFNLIDALFS